MAKKKAAAKLVAAKESPEKRSKEVAAKLSAYRALQSERDRAVVSLEGVEGRMASAMAEFHEAQRSGLDGDALNWMRARQKIRQINVVKERMLEAKKYHAAARDSLKELREELERINVEVVEDAMPIIAASTGKKPVDYGTAWKNTRVAHLREHGLAESIIETLEEAEMVTLGEVEDYLVKSDLADVPGMGEISARKYDDAKLDFLEAWDKLVKNVKKAEKADAPAVKPEVQEAAEDKLPEPTVQEVVNAVGEEREEERQDGDPTKLSDAGFPPAAVKILNDSKIQTVGELHAEMSTQGAPWLKRLLGIVLYEQTASALSGREAA